MRAEVAGACWATWIEQGWLARQDREVQVTLEHQSDLRREALRGWILFC